VPIPIAIAVGSGIIQGIGAIAKHQAQKKAAKANKKAALTNLKLMYDDLNAQASQQIAVAADARMNTAVEAEGLKGSATVGAASSNVAGASLTAILNDITRQEGQANSTIDRNLSNTLAQVQRQKRGARANAEAQIAGVQNPSWLATGLQIGGAALDTYSLLKR
jgi:hypothetical protein